MPMMEEDIGLDHLEPDRYLGPKRYRSRCKCLRCGHEYFGPISTKPDPKTPPCPKKACKQAAIEEEWARREANLRAILESGQAPATIGSNLSKAVDETYNVVSKDYGMTDLRDNIRPGEMAAPKLPPQQQKKVDGFFDGRGTGIPGRQMQMLGRRAIAGAYRSMAVSPASVIGAKPGESPLRVVRREPAK